MAEFTETVESIRTEEASVRTLFSEDGSTAVRDRRKTPGYMKKLAEAASFVADLYEGKRPMYHLREAMATDDFPILFADILDRQLLANYAEYPADYLAYVRASTVPDFRSVKRFAVDGAESVLPELNELEEYPEAALSESKDELSVKKYGRRLDLSWEALVNDDLDAFRRNPERLARAARRSEARFVTTLFVGASGPDSTLYSSSNGNVVTQNPALDIDALQLAMTMFAELVDEDDEPIWYDALELVVPPALEVVANNIVNSLQIEMTSKGGNSNQKLIARNWLQNRLNVVVNPYIPIIATSNYNTSWFLFASQRNEGTRPALEFAKLRGYEEPALYERAPNARRVGGGETMEAFEDDSVAWKVKHVFGGAQLINTGGAKSTIASNGSGS